MPTFVRKITHLVLSDSKRWDDCRCTSASGTPFCSRETHSKLAAGNCHSVCRQLPFGLPANAVRSAGKCRSGYRQLPFGLPANAVRSLFLRPVRTFSLVVRKVSKLNKIYMRIRKQVALFCKCWRLLAWIFALRAVFNVNVRQLAVNERQCFLYGLWCAMSVNGLATA